MIMSNIKYNKVRGRIGLFLMMVSLLLTSCVDYDDATRAVSVNIQLVMPEEFTNGSDYEGHTVTITRRSSGAQLTAVTNAEGIASFEGLIPDVYAVSTSWDITSEEYAQYTGDEVVTEGAVVSGNINTQLLAEDYTSVPLSLSTQLSINRSLVIGKVFSAGCKDNNNKNYLACQYIELYNQSNEPIDVAGLYIGLTETNSTPAYTLEQLAEVYDSKVLMLKQIFRIPTDQEKIVQPGGTIVIANSAIDHTQLASAAPNLLDADFDVNDTRARNAYTNNPAVPDLELIYTYSASLSFMNLVQGGATGIVIFRTEDNVADWELAYNYGKTSGSRWKVMPKQYVMDGVEILARKASTGVDIKTKRFYDDIDAGYTNINATTGYTGEVFYRKTSDRRGSDGHKILQDTNNSTNDFQISTTIAPREYDD